MYHSIIVIVVLSLSCVRLWLLCPQDFPPKNTGVGCHLLLQSTFPTQGWKSMSPALAGGFFFLPLSHLGLNIVVLKAAQLCPTLCDPMDYTVLGILRA